MPRYSWPITNTRSSSDCIIERKSRRLRSKGADTKVLKTLTSLQSEQNVHRAYPVYTSKFKHGYEILHSQQLARLINGPIKNGQLWLPLNIIDEQ